MPKGITPTRVRRRQSDAKWRASVAMCYNIMKNVIPNVKKMGRRKVSKALTLKETERHIVSLEKKLKEVIEERASGKGKVVMVERPDKTLYPASVEDIKADFAKKQQSFFASGNGNGKKRYNIPADIEASLENLSQQACRLVVMDWSDVSSFRPHHSNMTGNSHRIHSASTAGKHSSTTGKHPSTAGKHSRDRAQIRRRRSELEQLLLKPLDDDSDGWNFHVTPSKYRSRPAASCTRTRHTNVTPVKTVEKKAARPSGGPVNLLTPSKCCKQLPFAQSGFTPVKLPSGLDGEDQMLRAPSTPARSMIGSPLSTFSLPQTPGSGLTGLGCLEWTDDEDVSDLLCHETIDTLELEDTQTSGLSQPSIEVKWAPADKTSITSATETSTGTTETNTSKLRPESKCRRRLDVSYNDDQMVPSQADSNDTSCVDFDGYLIFYRQHQGESALGTSPSEAALTIYKMWEGLEPDERATYANMAVLENSHDSHELSADLAEIELKPLHHRGQQEKATFGLDDDLLVPSESYQEVPDLSVGGTSHGGDWELELGSDYGDLTVLYTDTDPYVAIKQDCGLLSTVVADLDDDSYQVVPQTI